MRPARKARGGRIPGVFNRRATPRPGMQRRPNVSGRSETRHQSVGRDTRGGDYNDSMLTLRYAALLAAAVWTGGLLTLTLIAAPSLFDTLAKSGVSDGRVLAGALFGGILRRFHVVSYTCGAVIAGSLIVRGALGPRPAYFGLRLGIVCAMLATALLSGLVISGRIEQARASAGGSPSTLPADDPRRVSFGRLHAASTILQIVPVLGGLFLMFRELTD